MADKSVGSLLNRVVLPGDVIGSVADLEGRLEGKNKIKLGPGLREVNGVIMAYKAGVFSFMVIMGNGRASYRCSIFFIFFHSSLYYFN